MLNVVVYFHCVLHYRSLCKIPHKLQTHVGYGTCTWTCYMRSAGYLHFIKKIKKTSRYASNVFVSVFFCFLSLIFVPFCFHVVLFIFTWFFLHVINLSRHLISHLILVLYVIYFSLDIRLFFSAIYSYRPTRSPFSRDIRVFSLRCVC